MEMRGQLDARKLVSHAFRAPVDGAWTFSETWASEHLLTHEAAPGFEVRLSKL